MRISYWSSDVCSSDLLGNVALDGSQARRQELSRIVTLYGIDVGRHVGILLGIVGAEFVIARRVQAVGVMQGGQQPQHGSASCMERVCQYWSVSGVAVPLNKKILTKQHQNYN